MPALKYQSAPGVWSPLSLVDAPTPTQTVFTSNGSWIKPPGATYVVVEVVGGGGAGGGSTASATGQHSVGAGGGSGGYARGTYLASALGATETVTVGTGGAGVSGANGGAGTLSSFGSWIQGNPGAGGTATATTSASAYGVLGGLGGSVTGGDLQIAGAPGENCWGNGSFCIGGNGGSNPLGSGGRGWGSASTGQAIGNAGAGYGSGGGGSGIVNQVGTAQVGGAGAGGVVIVTTYYAGSSSSAGVPAVDTGWIALGAPALGAVASGTPGYRRLNGVLYLRGSINTNAGTPVTAGSFSTLYTLPAGFRPIDTVMFGASSNTTTTITGQVTSGGVLQVYVSAATAAWFNLAACSPYPTDQ